MAIVTVLTDPEALAAAAAERVTSLIAAAIAARQRARVCLSGGQTPLRLYELLADASRPWRSRIDWTRVHVFWGDERQVPPGEEESNFGMAQRVLLAQVPIPADQVHRMRGELSDAADAAREYEVNLRAVGRDGALFDLVLLGLGEDAHIASIFPGGFPSRGASLGGLSRANPTGFAPPDPLVAAVYVEYLCSWRITLTPSAVLDSRAILVLASGDRKAAAARAALDGPEDVSRWPAQLLRAAGDRVEWLMDAAAARRRAVPPA